MDTTFAWLYYSVIAINVFGIVMNELTRRKMKKTKVVFDAAITACEVAFDRAIKVSVDTANEAERRRSS